MATHNERRLARAPGHEQFNFMDFDVNQDGTFRTIKIQDRFCEPGRERVLILHVNKTEIIPEE